MNAYVDRIYDDITILALYVYLWNPRDILISSVVLYIENSRLFLDDLPEDTELKNLWTKRALLEGLPNISLTYLKCESNVPSVIHLSSLVKVAAQLTSFSRYRAKCEIPCVYNFKNILEFAAKLLRECIRDSEKNKGIIFMMDMAKSTDFIVRTKDDPNNLSFSIIKLKGLLSDFGNRINIMKKGARFWILEGDKFISFIPIDPSDSGLTIWNTLISIYQNLKKIKDRNNIGFKAGAHFGWLVLMGDFIYSNTDIIITTRVMEFSKRDDVIIITDDLRKEVLMRLRGTNIDIEEFERGSFKAPRILIEGKPAKWIRPTKVSISVNGNEIEVFEIGE